MRRADWHASHRSPRATRIPGAGSSHQIGSNWETSGVAVQASRHPPVGTDYLGRHAKRPKVKRTTLPEPSPYKAAGDDTAEVSPGRWQKEEGVIWPLQHHGQRT